MKFPFLDVDTTFCCGWAAEEEIFKEFPGGARKFSERSALESRSLRPIFWSAQELMLAGGGFCSKGGAKGVGSSGFFEEDAELKNPAFKPEFDDAFCHLLGLFEEVCVFLFFSFIVFRVSKTIP